VGIGGSQRTTPAAPASRGGPPARAPRAARSEGAFPPGGEARGARHAPGRAAKRSASPGPRLAPRKRALDSSGHGQAAALLISPTWAAREELGGFPPLSDVHRIEPYAAYQPAVKGEGKTREGKPAMLAENAAAAEAWSPRGGMMASPTLG